ncbi:unnamed protein product [Arctogadus glacialis]
MTKRNRLSFTPTLGLSLNKREKDQSSPGTQSYQDQSYPDQSSQSFPLSSPCELGIGRQSGRGEGLIAAGPVCGGVCLGSVACCVVEALQG